MTSKPKSPKTVGKTAIPDINFKFKSIRTSVSEVVDYVGNKHYRSVFRLNEVETLFVDTEIVNKLFDEKPWEAEIMAVLFYMDGKQPVAIAQKGGRW